MTKHMQDSHITQYRALCDKQQYHKKLHLRRCMSCIWTSETADLSLNVMNRGRPCRLNSLLGTLPHLISREHPNGNINKHNCNNNSNNVTTSLE